MRSNRLLPIVGCLCAAQALLQLGAAQNPGGVGLAAAREELKNFKTAEGLEVSLFAAEPMVRNPANMDVDARGRVWVTEGANYRLWQKWGKLRPEGDRIVILEDTDGDGRMDKATVFLDKLVLPRAVWSSWMSASILHMSCIVRR